VKKRVQREEEKLSIWLAFRGCDAARPLPLPSICSILKRDLESAMETNKTFTA